VGATEVLLLDPWIACFQTPQACFCRGEGSRCSWMVVADTSEVTSVRCDLACGEQDLASASDCLSCYGNVV